MIQIRNHKSLRTFQTQKVDGNLGDLQRFELHLGPFVDPVDDCGRADRRLAGA